MRVRRVRRHDAATWRRGDVGLTSIDTGKNNTEITPSSRFYCGSSPILLVSNGKFHNINELVSLKMVSVTHC